MRLGVSQTTTYSCDQLRTDHLCRVRLTPLATGQKVLSWDLQVADATHQVTFDDHHGNPLQLWSLPKGATEIKILCAGEVETEDRGGVVDRRPGLVPLELYSRPSDGAVTDDSIIELCRHPDVVDADGALARAHALSRTVHDLIGSAGTGDTESAADTDDATAVHVHRFMAAARHMEVPVRFVSGYVLAAPEERIDAEDGPDDEDDAGGEDTEEATPVSGSHSWAEAWVTGLGWVAFDIINAVCADDRYIRVRVGVDAIGARAISVHGPTISAEATTVIMESLGSE